MVVRQQRLPPGTAIWAGESPASSSKVGSDADEVLTEDLITLRGPGHSFLGRRIDQALAGTFGLACVDTARKGPPAVG
jgi:hypothetical protein